MSVDIYHSRRGHFKRCAYFNRDEDDYISDLTKWVLVNKPSGFFYAKEVSVKTNQANQLGNVLMFDKNMITLQTGDLVADIKRGSVVEYLNHAWLVQSVQFELSRKETEFGEDRYITYISITR